jgi:uncharacterized membrane protein YphA (DoxX/SURF4 family)
MIFHRQRLPTPALQVVGEAEKPDNNGGLRTGVTALATTRYQIGFTAALAIAVLRVGIGVHFFSEGLTKLRDDRPFSAPFFGNAKGPLAPYYKRLVWDADGLYRLDANGTKLMWDDYRNRVVARYQFDEAQRARAEQILQAHRDRLDYAIGSRAGDVNQYYAELKRRDANAADPTRSLASLRAHDARIAQERTQLIAPVLADIDGLWKGLEDSLNNLATTEQRQGRGRLAIGKIGRQPVDSVFLDFVIPYFDMAVGLCLILGLFTRPAAAAGGLFLATVCLSQWPGAEGAVPIYSQSVEMLALFALAAIGAGQFAGLDYFLSAARRLCCPPKAAGAKT